MSGLALEDDLCFRCNSSFHITRYCTTPGYWIGSNWHPVYMYPDPGQPEEDNVSESITTTENAKAARENNKVTPKKSPESGESKTKGGAATVTTVVETKTKTTTSSSSSTTPTKKIVKHRPTKRYQYGGFNIDALPENIRNRIEELVKEAVIEPKRKTKSSQ